MRTRRVIGWDPASAVTQTHAATGGRSYPALPSVSQHTWDVVSGMTVWRVAVLAEAVMPAWRNPSTGPPVQV